MNEREIFIAALHKSDSTERAAYLAQACGEDGVLRQHVETLLREHEQLGDFLESPAPGIPSPLGGEPQVPDRGERGVATIDEPISERPGTVIDRYKLLEQIGEGAFGVVFMAEQAEPIRRKVALKVLKPGMDTKQVTARFEAERQALAIMDHPNIARVFDGGATNTGRPFFVMELVKGVPITQFCDEQKQSPRQRLELFLAACHAVQHAHQKGIIHRDLKPSNVLVSRHDTTPVVKVIDFGIAKALGQELTEKTLFTGVAQMIGTPLYMSPEQAGMSDLDIDTRSDIYSLGVLLYEMLTGSTPFTKERFKKAAYDEIRRIIREEDPPKPSTRLSDSQDSLPSISAQRQTDPSKLTRMMRGELDWIVMKALEKDRNRRYDTANSLALDILRYLHEEPVLARSPSSGYRLRKFVRRHPAPVALAAVSLVAVLALVAFSVGQFYNVRLASTNAQLVTTSEHLDEALHAAKIEKAKARQYLYVSQMTLAERARQESQFGRMMQLLRSVIPESPEEEDLRGFEWYHLWRQYHGEQSRLRGHSGPVTAVAFSPDGQLLASGSSDKTVRLWNGITGKQVLTLLGHLAGITAIAFSPDGQRLASASVDKTVKLWDTQTGRQLKSLVGHQDAVICLAFSPDGKQLASGSEDRTVRVWDGNSGKLILEFKDHRWPVSDVAFLPDSKRVASTSKLISLIEHPQGEVFIWNARTGHRESALIPEIGNAVTALALNHEGTLLAIGITRNEKPTNVVQIWDIQSGKTIRSLEGHTNPITHIALSPDGKRLASCGLDRTLRIWPLALGTQELTFHDESPVMAVAFSPDGLRLVSGSDDTTVKIWSPPEKEARTLFHGVQWINNVAFSPDGRQLAAATHGRELLVWNVVTGKELMRVPIKERLDNSVQCARVAWSPDGRCLGSGFRVWDAASGLLADPPLDHADLSARTWADGSATTFSRDGKLLAAVAGGAVCVWDRATGRRTHTLAGPATDHPEFGSAPCALALSANNQSLTVGNFVESEDKPGAVVTWDLTKGQVSQTLEGFRNSVFWLCLSPDEKLIAAAIGGLRDYAGASGPGEVLVWDTATGRQVYHLRGHPYSVYSVAFSPDGRRLASAGGAHLVKVGGEVKIWDMNTGLEVATLKGFTTAVSGVTFSPCGTQLATCDLDGTVKIWDGTPLAETPTRESGEKEREAAATPQVQNTTHSS